MAWFHCFPINVVMFIHSQEESDSIVKILHITFAKLSLLAKKIIYFICALNKCQQPLATHSGYNKD